MYYQLLILKVFFIAVFGKNSHLELNLEKLSSCIGVPFKSNSKHQQPTKVIADLVARTYYAENTKTTVTSEITHQLKDEHSLRKQLKKALEACSKVTSRTKRSDNQFNPLFPLQTLNRLVRFRGESDAEADVLNYMLVQWQLPFRRMVRTREGRATLRRYKLKKYL